jgi:hypothetical protein
MKTSDIRKLFSYARAIGASRLFAQPNCILATGGVDNSVISLGEYDAARPVREVDLDAVKPFLGAAPKAELMENKLLIAGKAFPFGEVGDWQMPVLGEYMTSLRHPNLRPLCANVAVHSMREGLFYIQVSPTAITAVRKSSLFTREEAIPGLVKEILIRGELPGLPDTENVHLYDCGATWSFGSFSAQASYGNALFPPWRNVLPKNELPFFPWPLKEKALRSCLKAAQAETEANFSYLKEELAKGREATIPRAILEVQNGVMTLSAGSATFLAAPTDHPDVRVCLNLRLLADLLTGDWCQEFAIEHAEKAMRFRTRHTKELGILMPMREA